MLVLALQFSRSRNCGPAAPRFGEPLPGPHAVEVETSRVVAWLGRLREGSNPSKRKRRRCLSKLLTRGGTESLNPCWVVSTDAPVHQQVCVVLPDQTDVDHRQTKTLLRKEVIQPHLPVRLPCYDFTPVTNPTFDGSLLKGWATGFGCCRLPWCDGRCVQGPGTYSPWRADPGLLATPASWSRVADSNPN